VETIKAKVPSNERNYDPDNNHAWFLSEQWYTALLPLMEALFQDCQFNIIDKKKVEEYSQGAATSYLEPTEKMVADFKALIIVAVPTTPENGEFNKLPLNEVQKYYRKAALYYHPDRNPQFASEMTRLNQLFMELKKLEYWK
jgi:hypothetical protein